MRSENEWEISQKLFLVNTFVCDMLSSLFYEHLPGKKRLFSYLKVVSTTFLLICFLSQKGSFCETSKNSF